MPLFERKKKSKDKKKKKEKKTTTTDDTTKKKKKKSKNKHGKHHQKKGSKGTKDVHGAPKERHGESEPKKKKKSRLKLPRTPPAEDEELGDVILVRDWKKVQAGAPGGTCEPLQPPWKPSTTPAFAYHSVEEIETPQIPAILGGPKMPVVAERKKPSPVKTADNGMVLKKSRSRHQKKISSLKKENPEKKQDKEKDEAKDEVKDVLIAEERKSKNNIVPKISPSQKKEKKKDSKSEKGDLTKKEERSEKDRRLSKEEELRKWRGYADRVLDSGIAGIAKEFRQIKGHLPTAVTRTAFDEHPEDNRFEDIVCVDQSRVELKDVEEYINASWVQIDKEKKMILTQLPLPHTASRFWQMILETDTQAIFLILTGYEYDMFLAEATFPAQQDFLHFQDRHIRVGEFKRIKVAPGWMMRVLSITNGDKKKYLHLHHYYRWYHGQELKSFKDLLAISSVFKKYKGPPVVVSLSGCGRAGTFAAFELAHSRLHNHTVEKMSVADAVQRVRDGRMHAVQRAAQLKTIHLAMLEHVLGNGLNKDLSDRQKEAWEEMQKIDDD